MSIGFHNIPYYILTQGSYLTKEGIDSLDLDNPASLANSKKQAFKIIGLPETVKALRKIRAANPDKHFYFDMVCEGESDRTFIFNRPQFLGVE